MYFTEIDFTEIDFTEIDFTKIFLNYLFCILSPTIVQKGKSQK